MHDDTGTKRYGNGAVADVFATFYEGLYQGSAEYHVHSSSGASIAEFTHDEPDDALKKLRAGKACDANGVVAEMLKYGGQQLKLAILGLFNDVIREQVDAPEMWKITRLVVIF